MKKFQAITATAQGIIIPDHNGKPIMQSYTQSFQSKSSFKSKRVQSTADNLEKVNLNIIQRSMFRRLMYGLQEYTPEQMSSMSPQVITKIVEDYKKAKRALHILKAKQYYQAETKLLAAIFPHTRLGKSDFDWLVDLPKSVTLRNLGISTKNVIDEFINRKLLPSNFYQISPENVLING
jgi:hypothetical protein